MLTACSNISLLKSRGETIGVLEFIWLALYRIMLQIRQTCVQTDCGNLILWGFCQPVHDQPDTGFRVRCFFSHVEAENYFPIGQYESRDWMVVACFYLEGTAGFVIYQDVHVHFGSPNIVNRGECLSQVHVGSFKRCTHDFE